MSQSSVRYLGSRELHRELPRILDELNDPATRLVLTIHAKPKAVMIGAEAFSELVSKVSDLDLQLGEDLKNLLDSASVSVKDGSVKTRSRLSSAKADTRIKNKVQPLTQTVSSKSPE